MKNTESTNPACGKKLMLLIDGACFSNLPFRAEDDDVRELFSRFGSVAVAKVVFDKDTDESTGL